MAASPAIFSDTSDVSLMLSVVISFFWYQVLRRGRGRGRGTELYVLYVLYVAHETREVVKT